jgi:DNA topoisomerase-1
LNDPAAAKPKTGSLFATMNAATITFEEALKLLSLPRTIGVDPETNVAITAQNGKFGPYITRGKDSRSLTSEDQIFDITLEGALALLAPPKARGRQTAATPLREFGEDPASQLPVVAKTGQFGNYVTDGVINATVPKEEPLDELSADRAFELLAIRREKLGLEPGEPAPKAGKTGKSAAKKVAPARTVKRGSTRK